MTITEFLLARISDDEAVALKASEQIGQRWCGGGGELRTLAHGDPRATEPCWLQVAKMGSEYGPHGRPAEWETGWWPRVDAFAHMARHDPARVLAECAAKRAIVERYIHNLSLAESYRNPKWRDAMNDQDRIEHRMQEARAATSLEACVALAAIYADHPDYQPEWEARHALRSGVVASL